MESPKVKTLHDLPPEMLCAIFQHLSLMDLLKFKSVCKLWNELIPKTKIERLFVDPAMEVWEQWYHSNRQCNERELCHPDLFVVQCRRPLLSNLKYLKLENRVEQNELSYFDFMKLNTFRQLVQLEVSFAVNDLRLNLPHLVVLSLDWRVYKSKVELNCPKLKILRYNESEARNLLHVEHPESIRELETTMFGDKLARFTNLEVLRYTFTAPLIDRSTLSKLKKLKSIHYGEVDFQEFDQSIAHCMRLKRELGRSDLAFYFFGLPFVDGDIYGINFDLDDQAKKDHIEELQIRHYDQLQDKLTFVYRVDYNHLFSLFDVLPDDYFTRFPCLQEVSATSPLDEQHFLSFLKKIIRLKWLSLFNSDLSQKFFDELPNFCSPTNFYLWETYDSTASDQEDDEESKTAYEEESEAENNFGFIGKFKQLFNMAVKKNLSVASLRTLLNAFTGLRRIMYSFVSFRCKGIDFELGWNVFVAFDDRHRAVYLKTGQKQCLELVTLDEVVEFFKNPENLKNLTVSDDVENGRSGDNLTTDPQ